MPRYRFEKDKGFAKTHGIAAEGVACFLLMFQSTVLLGPAIPPAALCVKHGSLGFYIKIWRFNLSHVQMFRYVYIGLSAFLS